MSTSKRRKLDVSSNSPRELQCIGNHIICSQITGLSAFVARKALQRIGSSHKALGQVEEAEEAEPPNKALSKDLKEVPIQAQSRKTNGAALESQQSDSNTNDGQPHQELYPDGQSSYVHLCV